MDVVEHPALAKQMIGVVSQQNTLDRQLTVWENLYFHGRLFGIGAAQSRQEADRLLAQFHLTKWANASVFALSGGMAQRLMVARAIFHRPAVLFLDEPTAGLDPQSRLALWEILGDLNRAGQTIMLLTHYMEEADQLCSRVAIIDHGKVLALDTPAALKQTVGADTIVTVKAHRRRRSDRVGTASRGAGGVTTDTRDRRRRRAARQGRRADHHGVVSRGGQRRARARRRGGLRADARERVHQPHRQGAARMTRRAAARRPAAPHPSTVARRERRSRRSRWRRRAPRSRRAGRRSARSSCETSIVLKKNFGEFVARTIVQPFLLVFVFLYVFPRIGQGIGGGGAHGSQAESAFATVLVPGVVAISIMFQGIQAVALQMSTEFGFTREIEDRVQAPCPLWLIAAAKVLSGAVQGLLAAVIVFPIAAVIHASGVHAHLSIHWPIVLTLIPLACVAMTSLGLLLGTTFEPRNIGLMFGFVVLPLTFLGGTYYQWTRLAPVTVGGVHWLQILVLINPLIYIAEGMRAGLTEASHMPLYVIYPVLCGFAVLFWTLGLRNFKRRVLV